MDWPLIHLIYAPPYVKVNILNILALVQKRWRIIRKKLFPKARVERMDMDTTSKKGSHETILQNMKDEKKSIY